MKKFKNIVGRRIRHRQPNKSIFNSFCRSSKMKRKPRKYLLNICDFKDNVIYKILEYFVGNGQFDNKSISTSRLLSSRFKFIFDNMEIWQNEHLPIFSNISACYQYKMVSLACTGSEGFCFDVVRKSNQVHYAFKRSKPFVLQDNDTDHLGVQYFLLREVVALKMLDHCNVSPLLQLNYTNNSKISMIFPFVSHSLHDIIFDKSPLLQGKKIDRQYAIPLLRQLLEGLAHCHERGVMHRNLKPKHLLIKVGTNPMQPLDGAVLQISDFAMCRRVTYPARQMTNEIVSLWYRPPELLMGETRYDQSIDMWSVGCIFVEMLRGKALFLGMTQVEQLFRIYSILGRPSSTSWPEHSKLPHYDATVIPQFTKSTLRSEVPGMATDEFDLLAKFLTCNPKRRISAIQASQHKAFKSPQPDSPSYPTRITFPPAVTPSYYLSQQHNDKHYQFNLQLESEKWLNLNDVQVYRDAHHSRRRLMLVDFLCQQKQRYGDTLSLRTVFLAVGLFDRFMLTHNNKHISGSGNSGNSGSSGSSGSVIDNNSSSMDESNGCNNGNYDSRDCVGSSSGIFSLNSSTDTPSTEYMERCIIDDWDVSCPTSSEAQNQNRYNIISSTSNHNRTANMDIMAEENENDENSCDSKCEDLDSDSHSNSVRIVGDSDNDNDSDNGSVSDCDSENVGRNIKSGPIIGRKPGKLHYDIASDTAELDIRLVGVTCLLLAAKCEDEVYVAIQDILPSTWKYDRSEIYNTEGLVLSVLQFDLCITVVSDFTYYYADLLCKHGLVNDNINNNSSSSSGDNSTTHKREIEINHHTYSLSNAIQQFIYYLSEITIHFVEFTRFKPSVIAQCIVLHAVNVLVLDATLKDTLSRWFQEKISGYSRDDNSNAHYRDNFTTKAQYNQAECLALLQKYCSQLHKALPVKSSIVLKYSQVICCEVAFFVETCQCDSQVAIVVTLL